MSTQSSFQPPSSNWHFPTAVRFGAGRVKELGDICATFGVTRPLVVTDPGLRDAAPVARAVAALEGAGLASAVFSEVRGNPTGKNVDEGVVAAKAHGCDGVVAVGGGSALDVGKAVALMVGQDRPMWDFEDVGDNYKRVNVAAMVPTIAVPTTAGTGSEVGRSSVITHEEQGRKVVIFHANMMPVASLCDPELTVSLPKKLTAATGMDALAHNLEALCAPGFHPMADGIGAEGVRLVFHYVERAMEAPEDLEARGAMQAASLMGATAFQKGLGAIHALSHPVGARFDAHHGLLNAVFMPYVLVFNRDAIEERIARLAAWCGLEDATFNGFLKRILDLRAELEIPHTLDALGVGEAHVDELAAMAVEDPTAGGNPIPLDVPALAGMYRKALAGDVG